MYVCIYIYNIHMYIDIHIYTCVYIYIYMSGNVWANELNPIPFSLSPSVMAEVKRPACFNQLGNVQNPWWLIMGGL